MSQSKFKKSSLLAGTALVAAGVMTAGTASADGHAKVVSSGTDKTTMKIAGHVSRQVTILDDGRTAVRHSDSDFSSSRLVITAAGKVNSSLKVGTKIETAVDDNRNAGAVHDSENGGRSGDDLQTRKAEIYLTHSSLGKVSMGAGDMASNGVSETSILNYSMLPGAVGLANNGAFRDADGTAQADVRDVIGQSDGLGRSTRIRYDTPNVAGFVASASHEDNQAWDVALRYGGKFAGTKIKAAASWANDSTVELLSGGIGLQHSSGIGVNYGFEHANDETRSDTRFEDFFQQHGSLSYTGKFSEMGKSQLVYEYIHADNKTTNNDTAYSHSVGFHQKVDAAAMEIAVRYSHIHLDRDGQTFDNDDVNSLSIHTRVKF